MLALQNKNSRFYQLINRANDFMKNKVIPFEVYERAKLIQTDSLIAGICALSMRNIQTLSLKEVALGLKFKGVAFNFSQNNSCLTYGNSSRALSHLSISANIFASSQYNCYPVQFGQTSKGYISEKCSFIFSSVATSVAQETSSFTGEKVLKAAILLEEIHSKIYANMNIDPVIADAFSGAIAAGIVYGILNCTTNEQIISGIDMFMKTSLPFNFSSDIEQNCELFSSKPNFAFLTESVISSINMFMNQNHEQSSFVEGSDKIFKNKKQCKINDNIFDINLEEDPFELSIMKANFKLGLYPLEIASSIQSIFEVFVKERSIECFHPSNFSTIFIFVHSDLKNSPVFKSNLFPSNFEEMTHSPKFVLSILIAKMLNMDEMTEEVTTTEELWEKFILLPEFYNIFDKNQVIIKTIFDKIVFKFDNQEINSLSFEDLPTKFIINGEKCLIDSGIIVNPPGHPKNKKTNFKMLIRNKFEKFIFIEQQAYSKIVFQNWLKKMEYFEELKGENLSEMYKFSMSFQNIKMNI